MQSELGPGTISLFEKAIPASWYYLAPVWNGRRPKKFIVVKKEILVYKTEREWVAISSRCLHMNADLSCGKRIGNHVQCPMHQWTYADTGQLVSPSLTTNKSIKSFEIVERLEHLFIFIGDVGKFALPFQNFQFHSLSRPMHLRVNSPMYMQAANGFDVHHFALVHGRRIEKVLSQAEDESSISIDYEFKNVSTNWRDRLIRRFVNPKVNLHFSVHGGNLILAKICIGKRSYQLLTFLEPVTDTSSRAIMFSVLPKSLFGFFKHFTLGYFIKRFFEHEIKVLDGVRIQDFSVADLQDKVLMNFLSWYKKRITLQQHFNFVLPGDFTFTDNVEKIKDTFNSF